MNVVHFLTLDGIKKLKRDYPYAAIYLMRKYKEWREKQRKKDRKALKKETNLIFRNKQGGA